VSGSGDNTVRVWELSTGKCMQVFDDATARVTCLDLHANIAVAGADDGVVSSLNRHEIRRRRRVGIGA
jgi:F-box/WD-40 domain protein 7